MRRAFLVLGAESSGSRFVADILRAAGCKGATGHNGHWQEWDMFPPAPKTPIVWHRSFPHGDIWHTIPEMMECLAGYAVTAIVSVRDWHCMSRSQQAFRSEDEVRHNLKIAYPLIFGGIAECGLPHIVVSYEALTANYEAYARYILGWLGLPDDVELPELMDGNRKYYEVENAI